MRAAAIMQLTLFLGLFLTDAQTPLEVMDGWLRPVAEWNPLTRVLGVARQGFVGGPDWSTTLTGIAAMAVLSVLTALFAFTGIRRLDA
jgi:ABC-2 type transport system permease protein